MDSQDLRKITNGHVPIDNDRKKPSSWRGDLRNVPRVVGLLGLASIAALIWNPVIFDNGPHEIRLRESLSFWLSDDLASPYELASAKPDLSMAPNLNGFDLRDSTVPVKEIRSGGVPRDGIPAILTPKFIPADQARFLKDSDQIVGLTSDGQARAYPLRILVWHELVNDTFGGKSLLISYCPLCGTSMVFDRTIDGRILTFGVSGLLYNSDVLMYDHTTQSLWSQLKMEGVTGLHSGAPLEWLPSELTTWKKWRETHPHSDVLSTDTGSRRDYTVAPYAGYENSPSPVFPVAYTRRELPQKDWVVGVVVNHQAKAYSLNTLKKRGHAPLEDTVGGVELRVHFDADSSSVRIRDLNTNELIPSVNVYWFAWQAFQPETQLFAD